jgi:SAM-dependent methyltransferase
MRRYDARLGARTLEGALRRWLLTPVGTFLTNTPVFLLPGQVNLQPKHRVLDLQGGRAGIARFLAARIPFERPPVALDSSLVALRLARRDLGSGAGVALVAGRPTRLPFHDASFDLVIAAHLFRRLTDEGLVVCLQEAERVLRPGGILVGWDFASLSSRTLNRLHQRVLAGDPRPPRLRGFGPLAHYASEAGFVRIERPMLRPFLFPPIPHTAILAQKHG